MTWTDGASRAVLRSERVGSRQPRDEGRARRHQHPGRQRERQGQAPGADAARPERVHVGALTERQQRAHDRYDDRVPERWTAQGESEHGRDYSTLRDPMTADVVWERSRPLRPCPARLITALSDLPLPFPLCARRSGYCVSSNCLHDRRTRTASRPVAAPTSAPPSTAASRSRDR